MTPTAASARTMMLALLAARAPGKTVCPSEVARALAAAISPTAEWRGRMPEVHDAVDALLDEGLVRLSWKREPLAVRAGPYRIKRTPPPE